jgi:hypothetical protein
MLADPCPSASAELDRHYRCELACDAPTRGLASALIDRVYQQKLGLARPDTTPTPSAQVRILLIRCPADPSRAVATMTLQSGAFAPAGAPSPFELEDSYRLESLGLAREQLLEVRRMAVEPGHPGAVQCLYAAATRVSLEHGVRTWLGLVEARGELESDVALVHRVLGAHGLLIRPLPLEPRASSALFDEDALQHRPAFSPEQLQRLLPPQRIRAFARLFGARGISVPALHPRYRRVVVPMLAHVDAFRDRWFGESQAERSR